MLVRIGSKTIRTEDIRYISDIRCYFLFKGATSLSPTKNELDSLIEEISSLKLSKEDVVELELLIYFVIGIYDSESINVRDKVVVYEKDINEKSLTPIELVEFKSRLSFRDIKSRREKLLSLWDGKSDVTVI